MSIRLSGGKLYDGTCS